MKPSAAFRCKMVHHHLTLNYQGKAFKLTALSRPCYMHSSYLHLEPTNSINRKLGHFCILHYNLCWSVRCNRKELSANTCAMFLNMFDINLQFPFTSENYLHHYHDISRISTNKQILVEEMYTFKTMSVVMDWCKVELEETPRPSPNPFSP